MTAGAGVGEAVSVGAVVAVAAAGAVVAAGDVVAAVVGVDWLGDAPHAAIKTRSTQGIA